MTTKPATPISIGRYRHGNGLETAAQSARVMFAGKLRGHLVRRYSTGYNPRFGAVSKLSGWQFWPINGGEPRHFSAVMGQRSMLRALLRELGE